MAKGLVNKKRVRSLSTGDEGAGPVVYWCSRDQRVEDNWALIYACDKAAANGVPVVVVFSLVTKFLGAGARQFGFMLRGLKEMDAALAARGIPFVLLKGDPGETVASFANAVDANTVVCDSSPLRLGIEWRNAVAAQAKAPTHEVDAHNVVPVWEASPKLEVGARTLRGKLAKLYPEFLVPFPELPDVSGLMKTFRNSDTAPAKALEARIREHKHDWDVTIADAVARGASVPEVAWAVPGEAAAKVVLEHFLTRRLRLYESRNDPAKPQSLSGLSPYLHFGQISGARCAMEAKKHAKSAAKAVETFFEELVVRRELADNFCWYSPKYDSLEGQKYDWAKDTLRLHASDKRDKVYGLEQFESAKTHDSLWNAAQKELVFGGKMHGFMRMYWAKKILEWTESPERALEFAIFLNDKYSLDGRDPSGYVGCAWSIVGVHDQGWKERPVFGKIRYMAYSGCEKKFKIPDYIARVNQLVEAVKAGKTNCSEVNPGRFHIDFASKAGAGTAGKKEPGVASRPNATREAVSAEELTRMVKAATKAGVGDAGRAVDALQALGKVTITAELLAETGAGKSVKALSKQTEDAVVAAAAAAVVQAWKKSIAG
jgi:deoxyribodipyrimidine photo-lyase